MGATPTENVDIELIGLGEEQIGFVGDKSEPLEEANA